MPALTNPKHEKFAQLVATGYSKRQAHISAGYIDNRSNASLLSKRPDVRARINELKDQNFVLQDQVTENIKQTTQEKVPLEKKWILDRLVENAVASMIGNQRTAANRALELLGKELGMFMERTELNITNDLAKLSDEELLAKLQEEMRLTIDHEPLTQTLEPAPIENEPDSVGEKSGSESETTLQHPQASEEA